VKIKLLTANIQDTHLIFCCKTAENDYFFLLYSRNILHYFGFPSDPSSTYLAEIQLENIADIMCIEF